MDVALPPESCPVSPGWVEGGRLRLCVSGRSRREGGCSRAHQRQGELGVCSGFVASSAFGGDEQGVGVDDQMQQMRQEICSWVALGKPVEFWQNQGDRQGGEGRGVMSLSPCLILQGLLSENLHCCVSLGNGG